MNDVDKAAEKLTKLGIKPKALITHLVAVITGFALGCFLCL